MRKCVLFWNLLVLSVLHRTGHFDIVDREDVSAILEEQKFQASDLADEEEVVELGGLVGVNLVVTCTAKALEGIYQITARLLIETEPSEADVYLFGVGQGATPIPLRLAAGPYLLSVESRGYAKRRKTFYVDEGQETSWKVEFIKKKRFRIGDYVGGRGVWNRHQE